MLGRKTSYSDPDTGTWEYTYDENGNLTSRTDARGKTISFEYVSLNRPAAKYYGPVKPENLKVRYFYDEEGHGCSKGRLTRLVKYTEPGSADVSGNSKIGIEEAIYALREVAGLNTP